MMNLKRLLIQLSPASNRLPLAGLIFSAIGFLDAVYLTVKFYVGGPIPCGFLEGCDIVAGSKYSHIGNFPLALLGVIFYFICFSLLISYLDRRDGRLLGLFFYFSCVGFAVSLGLVYLQIFTIGAICTYCMASALSSTVLFVLGLRLLKY